MKNMSRIKVLILTVCFGVGTATAGAGIIGYWDFTGEDEDAQRAPTTVAQGVSVSSITTGTDGGSLFGVGIASRGETSDTHNSWNFGAVAPVTGQRYNDPPYPAGNALSDYLFSGTGSKADVHAGDNDTFHEFSVTVDQGYIMDIDKLEFIFTVVQNSRAYGTFLRYSLDGFDTQTDIGYVECSVTWQWGNRPTTVEFDLSEVSDLQGLIAGETVDFRFIPYRVNGGGGEGRIDFREPTLMGTVIPEPSTLILLGLGGMVLLKRRRV